jgi:hypothetical protein
MLRVLILAIVAAVVGNAAGCSTCARWFGHSGAPCAPAQPAFAQPGCAYPGAAPVYPAPYAAGSPVMTDPNMVMPAPH